MNKISFFILVLANNLLLAQTMSEKEDALAQNFFEYLDVENSEKSFKIDSLLYDEVSKYLDFRGTVLEALK